MVVVRRQGETTTTAGCSSIEARGTGISDKHTCRWFSFHQRPMKYAVLHGAGRFLSARGIGAMQCPRSCCSCHVVRPRRTSLAMACSQVAQTPLALTHPPHPGVRHPPQALPARLASGPLLLASLLDPCTSSSIREPPFSPRVDESSDTAPAACTSAWRSQPRTTYKRRAAWNLQATGGVRSQPQLRRSAPVLDLLLASFSSA